MSQGDLGVAPTEVTGAGGPECLALLALVASGCAFSWEPLFDEATTAEALANVDIAPATEALTFARFETGGSPRAIAVTSYRDGVIGGVDLSLALGQQASDPISLFLEHSYDTLQAVAGSTNHTVSVAVEDLIIPVELRGHHIAAGTNFPEHADEAGVQDGPFLFPKLVDPTPATSKVAVGHALLDYEVELAWVPLAPMTEDTVPAHMGLILCSDYTDRDMLLRHLDPDHVESGKGFTTGKSLPGYLPVGNLFVVPRDYRAFADAVELRLYVNHHLRQRERVHRAVWSIGDLIRETWARRDVTWEHLGSRVSLLGDDRSVIEDRVLIMSGTPAGTVFGGLNTEQKASGFLDWLFFGWGDSIPDHAIDDYVTDARAAGVYLMPGDRVDIHVHRMGAIENEMVP